MCWNFRRVAAPQRPPDPGTREGTRDFRHSARPVLILFKQNYVPHDSGGEMLAKRLAVLFVPVFLLVSSAGAQVNELSITAGRAFVSTQTVPNSSLSRSLWQRGNRRVQLRAPAQDPWSFRTICRIAGSHLSQDGRELSLRHAHSPGHRSAVPDSIRATELLLWRLRHALG